MDIIIMGKKKALEHSTIQMDLNMKVAITYETVLLKFG